MAKPGAKARRLRHQAAAEALIRFGPELSGLRELQRQAQGTYRTDIRQARDTASGISAAARVARPQIQKVYQRAGGQLTNTFNQVQRDIAAPTVPQSAIEKAMIAENAGARTRIREERASSYKDLTNRIVGAQEGRAYATRAARGTLASELGKVQRRRQDVLREKGAFTAQTLSGLLEADLDRQTRVAIQRMTKNQQERNSLRASGINPDTGAAIPGGKLDPDANKQPGNQAPSKADQNAARVDARARARVQAGIRKDSIKGVAKIQDAATLWTRYLHLTKDGKPPSRADVEARLISEGYRKREIDIARDLIRGGTGRLSARGVAAMHELGWRVPARWRPRKYSPPPGFSPDAAQR